MVSCPTRVERDVFEVGLFGGYSPLGTLLPLRRSYLRGYFLLTWFSERLRSVLASDLI